MKKEVTLYAVLMLPQYYKKAASVGSLVSDKSNFKIRGKQALKSLCHIRT